MPIIFDTLAQLLNHDYDTLIDVRSPAEYAEDHVPGAVSMPALSNDQRAEIGTIYTQVNPFKARRLGATMVARNAATAIETHMQDKDGSWRPLVYCWRGGQRSGSFTSILQQIGWRAETIKGGYQSYRRLVKSAVYDEPLPHKLVLLDGFTGTAKTDILKRLPTYDVQVVDLEGLAHHRGSLLGAVETSQPSQKAFESALAYAFAQLDPSKPVVVEAESSKIGKLMVPPSIWAAMCAGSRIGITAPLAARARYLTEAYADIIADPDRLRDQLQPIRQHRGHEVVDHWESLISEGAFEPLAEALIVQHYDPAYAKSQAVHEATRMASLSAETLDAAGQDKLAQEVAALISQ